LNKKSLIEASNRNLNKSLQVKNKIYNIYIMNLKPIIKWAGGKADEIKQILPYIPTKYDTYLEPFIGGGALYFHLNPEKAVINDLHKELIDFYQSIKNGKSNDIYDFMKSHPNDEETYYKVRAYNNTDVLDNAKRFYYLRKTCFRGMMRYNKKGEFNISYGRYKTFNFDEIINKNYEKLLKQTCIFNSSFEKIFEDYNNENNFMFLDPPYDSKFTNYGFSTFGKLEHEKLAKCFRETNIKCLMIIGKTDFIEELYNGYIVGNYEKKYKFRLHSGIITSNSIDNTHLIIKNY
jgi:DNA adenine methylase